MNYNFDFISDIHMDFYVDVRLSEAKMRKKIKEFVISILPEKQQSILVIAGDIGHYNHQNIFLFEELKNYYHFIVLVNGNHDYYLVSSSSCNRYKNNSMKRILEMKEKSSKIENIYYLDGEVVELDGVRFGGVDMWYDFEYGKQILGKSQESLFYQWKEVMNDSKYIKGLDFFLNFREANKGKEKLNLIIDQCDVIITHVCPEWSKIPHEYRYDINTSYFYFDGKPYFNKINSKVWLWGHTHIRQDYEAHGCRFINASLGYPSERKNRKIVNITNENPWK